MKQNPRSSSPGFTIYELLVAIAIVAALAVISSITFNRMRGAGDKAAVLAVLRQLQIANTSHATDNNGRYVPISSWDKNNKRINDWHQNTTFLAYLTGHFANTQTDNPSRDVPVSILDPAVVRAKQRLWDFLFASYGYNEVGMPGSGANSSKGFLISHVTEPGRTAAFITATDWIAKYDGRLLWENSPVEGKSKDGKIAYRHDGKAVVVYYDGSTGLITPDDIRGFDARGGASHPFWKANY
jgi:prepilin-type N-terminal cleavage/methylation domain-containing protein